jgi:two-component system, cell cycle response regulator
MDDRKKNSAAESRNRMELNKDTIIDFEKRNTKVLVVDDDDNIRGLIEEILKNEHVPTTVCASGMEALDLIKREDFGIIISDIKIRDFDGMGLLKAAKVINPNSDVIIITGYPTVETAVTAMRFGAAEYFTKPFSVEQLRKSVNRLIEKRILERKLKVEKHQMEIQRFDEETGLFTNRYFHLLLAHEVTRSGRFNHTCGLLLTQIGGLKSLQDSEVDTAVFNGDNVMKSISRLLRACCRQIDFISRYAYDEFAFVLPESGESGVEAVIGRVRGRIEALNSQLAAKSGNPTLTPLFGAATYPQVASTKELLLSLASQNLLKNRA